MSRLDEVGAFCRRRFAECPWITTEDMVKEVRRFTRERPSRRVRAAMRSALLDEGIAQYWRGLYQDIRANAEGELKRLARKRAAKDNPQWEQGVLNLLDTKVSLPDSDLSPTLGECGIVLLERSMAADRKLIKGIETKLTMKTRVAAQLGEAIVATGDPDLVVRQAHEMGLIDWAAVTGS